MATLPPPSSSSVRAVVPGLAVAAAGAAAALALHAWADALNILTAAVLVGVVVRTVHPFPEWAHAGTVFARRRLLQAGVVLLGLRLSIGDVLDLGAPVLTLVLVTVAVTFIGTQALGRLAGLSPAMSLFLATGFSICGVSAIAAMSATREHEDEDVAASVALVTLCGSVAILLLPLLRTPLGLSEQEFGLWVGASVHDVGQVVATAGGVGAAALATAVVVKLVRVLLLAPLVAAASLSARRAARRNGDPRTGAVPFVPLFVVGFLVMVAVRSTGVVPVTTLEAAEVVQTLILAAALFCLGAGVDLRTLLVSGRRAAAVGLAAWVMVAGVSYAGVLVLR